MLTLAHIVTFVADDFRKNFFSHFFNLQISFVFNWPIVKQFTPYV